ncbi:Secreted protein OS=Streptomyces alboniger OX=132473 GN=CP975_26925 PE=4 SV=1 [Streptomyces alboniger]
MATQKSSAGRLGSAALTLLAATATVTLAVRQWQAEKARLHDRQLELEELAIRRKALAHQQRMQWELLLRAMDDPSLAEVIDTYDKSIPAERRRQFFYANAWYVHLYHLYRAGSLDREELYRHLREFFQSPVFREYWEASRHMRATLNESSVEAQLGHMVDGLVRDLDEAETDEWWVVGDPPTD